MGILEGLATGAATAGWSAKAAAVAWKRQKEVLKNQVQWRVNDYEGAGLNKYLAVTSGGGGGGGSVPMAAQVDFSRSANTAKDFKKLKPEMAILKEAAEKAKFDKQRAFYEVGTADYAQGIARNKAQQENLVTRQMMETRGLQTDRAGSRNRTEGAVYRGINQALDWFQPESRLQNAAKRKAEFWRD